MQQQQQRSGNKQPNSAGADASAETQMLGANPKVGKFYNATAANYSRVQIAIDMFVASPNGTYVDNATLSW